MASKDASKSVMGNLPSTRPARIGRRREGGDGEAATPAKPKATAAKATAKPKPKAKPAAAKPKAAAARPKATTANKPRAVRSGSPALKAAKDKKQAAGAPPRRKPQPAQPPRGTELVTTAVQAAGELAQIGLTLGGQAVKRAVRRLPKP